jgi:hypothetical protein
MAEAPRQPAPSPLWPLLLIGGVLFTLAARSGILEALLELIGGDIQDRSGRSAAADLSLQSLRHAIVGVDKRTIAAALGPPSATVGAGNFWSDNTWYYPLDRIARLALAIEFEQGIARQTEVLRSPAAR